MSNTRVGTAEKGWKGPKVKDRRNILKSRGARSVSRGARPVSRGARPVSRGARPVIWSETHRIEPIGFHLCTRIRVKTRRRRSMCKKSLHAGKKIRKPWANPKPFNHVQEPEVLPEPEVTEKEL